MATYFNWWGPEFFHKLIYLDSMGAGKKSFRFIHVWRLIFFLGDKDTFWMGSAAYHRGYHVVERDLELITVKNPDGSPWNGQVGVFNGAMGQFNPSNTSEIFSMHVRLGRSYLSKSRIVLTNRIVARPQS